MLMDLDPAKLPPDTQKVRADFRERYKKVAGYYPTAFATVGFDSAWALFKYVLPKAGEYDADKIREAAMSLDVPEGALTQGWGIKFADGSVGPHLGQNLRAKVGITQWQDGKLVLVSPENLAGGQLRAPK
jgi:branched-chain amino acid transport system substrate-binding protein